MTNLRSFAGGFVWVAVAAVLMLITFEPVAAEQEPAFQVSAEAPAASAPATV
jgi:hypothetical protein